MDFYAPFLQEYVFLTPKRIVFGVGYSEKCGTLAKEIGGKTVLFVTDPILEKKGISQKPKQSLEKEGFKLDKFIITEPEPSIKIANEITKLARSKAFDLVVSLGGGSVMDMGKLAAVMATNPGDTVDYLVSVGGWDSIPKAGIPHIAMTTTSGTGSEVSTCSMVTVRGAKDMVLSPKIVPDIAVVDPALTLTMPKKGTASCGIDALSQSIEAMTTNLASPYIDGIAMKTVELVGRSLKVACDQPNDIEARYNMSFAATLSGLAMNAFFDSSLGHFIAGWLGYTYHLPHGLCCGIALPYVMEYYLPTCVHKWSEVTKHMGESVDGLTTDEAARKAPVAVKKLIEEIGLPTDLQSVGVSKQDLPDMLQAVFLTCTIMNPLRPTKEDLRNLIDRIWEGRLLIKK